MHDLDFWQKITICDKVTNQIHFPALSLWQLSQIPNLLLMLKSLKSAAVQIWDPKSSNTIAKTF